MAEGRTRSWTVKRFAQAVGLASLLLATNYGDLLGGGADVRMHVPYRLIGICFAQILDIVVLGAVLFAIAWVFKPTRYYGWLRVVYMMLIPPWIMLRMRSQLPVLETKEGLTTILTLSWIALLLLILLRFPLWYRRAVRAADVVGIFLAVFAVCSIAQLTWVMIWRPAKHETKPMWAGKVNPPRQHARVVWVLFDELSMEQTFGHRAHDLPLPNFDALRAESTLYTQVQPIGLKTVKIVPSLLSGHVIDDFHYSFRNKLTVHDDSGEPGFHQLDGSKTIFADAQKVGFRTGVVGWYNPYCSLYASALDACFWTNFDRMDGNMAQRRSWRSNMARPLRDLAVELRAPDTAYRQECDFDVEQRYKTDRDLEAHAEAMIAEDQADFVFLHFSMPHSPNIWSRINDDYTHVCGSSYLDNIALADRELGKIMAMVQSSPRWKDTTVIVQGDHGWRVQLWDWLAAWTDEDMQASHDVFDPRPALLIHEAGQTTPATDDRKLPLMVVHQSLENVLAGKPAKP